MIHDIGDRTRKRYYLIWDKNINSGDQGRRDMHQQMQNGAMIAKCIIWWCAWRIDFWSNTIKANSTMSVVLLDWQKNAQPRF